MMMEHFFKLPGSLRCGKDRGGTMTPRKMIQETSGAGGGKGAGGEGGGSEHSICVDLHDLLGLLITGALFTEEVLPDEVPV